MSSSNVSLSREDISVVDETIVDEGRKCETLEDEILVGDPVVEGSLFVVLDSELPRIVNPLFLTPVARNTSVLSSRLDRSSSKLVSDVDTLFFVTDFCVVDWGALLVGLRPRLEDLCFDPCFLVDGRCVVAMDLCVHVVGLVGLCFLVDGRCVVVMDLCVHAVGLVGLCFLGLGLCVRKFCELTSLDLW